MKRKRKIVRAAAGAVAAALVLAVFLWSPLSNYPVSLAVMRGYSGIHEKNSIMAEKNITLEIPGGGITKEKDWYPFVMTFNDSEGFRRFLQQQDSADTAAYSGLDLTILYNFPAFDVMKGCSRLYDTASPYYNGFYGAYLVSGQVKEADGSSHPYGFLVDGSLDTAATAQVPRFDFQKLVLGDFGIRPQQMVFDWEITGTEESVEYAGSGGWIRADANLTVNGVCHKKETFRQSYLQYGPPGYGEGQAAFAPVEMYGRLYGKYFEEWDTSVFFYVLAREPDVVEVCDEKILSRSRLE